MIVGVDDRTGESSPGDARDVRKDRSRPVAGQRLFNIQQAAAQLGISRTTLYGLLSSGAVQSVRVGRRRLITAAALKAFVDALPEAPLGCESMSAVHRG